MQSLSHFEKELDTPDVTKIKEVEEIIESKLETCFPQSRESFS